MVEKKVHHSLDLMITNRGEPTSVAISQYFLNCKLAIFIHVEHYQINQWLPFINHKSTIDSAVITEAIAISQSVYSPMNCWIAINDWTTDKNG